MAFVNTNVQVGFARLPFGGVKHSGYGREVSELRHPGVLQHQERARAGVGHLLRLSPSKPAISRDARSLLREAQHAERSDVALTRRARGAAIARGSWTTTLLRSPKTWGAATTRLVRGGLDALARMGRPSEALYLTQGFVYDSAEAAEARFKGEAPRFVYSRYANPTNAMFEQRLALLEGAEACRSTGSGMSAVALALQGLLRAGDHLVASRALFGSCRWIVTGVAAALRRGDHGRGRARPRRLARRRAPEHACDVP